jgi:hypothetical protein
LPVHDRGLLMPENRHPTAAIMKRTALAGAEGHAWI